MNQPINYQPTTHKAPYTVQPPRFSFSRPWRLGLIVLTLGCLLLINAALFAGSAYATPEPPDTPTSAPTSFVPNPTAGQTPVPTEAPAQPPRSAFAPPHGVGVTALAFGSLLLVSMVLFVRLPVANPRRRDEHDE